MPLAIHLLADTAQRYFRLLAEYSAKDSSTHYSSPVAETNSTPSATTLDSKFQPPLPIPVPVPQPSSNTASLSRKTSLLEEAMKFPNLSPTHSSLAKCRQSLLAELGFARRQLITQIKTINPTWLNIQPCRSKNEYYTVVETPEFNICLFVLQRGQVIPLHDHPDMTVFGKIVAGEMEVKTYSQIDPRTSATIAVDGQGNNTTELKVLPSYRVVNKIISASSPDSLLVIDPLLHLFEGAQNDSNSYTPITNLHSFTALSEQVILMDIIGPPYNEERQCTFYRELEWNAVPVDRIHYSNKRPSSLSSSSSASSSSSSSSLSSRSSGSNNSVTNSDHKNNLFSSSPTSSSSSMTRLFNHLGLLSGDSSSSPPLPPLYEKFLLVQDPQLDCVCSPRVYQGLPVILNGSKSVVPYNLVAQQLLLSKSTLEQQQQQQRQQQQSLPHASKLTSVVNN